jgi:hypothetical protein
VILVSWVAPCFQIVTSTNEPQNYRKYTNIYWPSTCTLTHKLPPCFHNQLLPGSRSMPIDSTQTCTHQVQPISPSQSIKIKTSSISAPLWSPTGTELPAAAQYGVSKVISSRGGWKGMTRNSGLPSREFRDQSQRPIL